MAEGVFRDKAQELGLDIEFDSCGTGDWHVGDEPDRRAQECMKRHGSDISDLRGRQFGPSDFESFDLIFTMDESNHENVMKLDTNNEYSSKVKMLLNEVNHGSNDSVPDPYFGGDQGFDAVHAMISVAADNVLKRIRHE